MKVILDECLPRRLVRELHLHSVTTVLRQGWAGRRDSELLSLIRGEFDVFVTMDSNSKWLKGSLGLNFFDLTFRL